MSTASFFEGIIRKYLPDYLLTFKLVNANCLMVFITSKDGSIKRSMTLSLQDTKWKVVKRRLDSMLSSDVTRDNIECAICEDFHGKPDNNLVSCNKCGNNYCLYCYTDIMRANQGLIVCPFCRDEFGQKSSKEIVEKAIQVTFEKSKHFRKMRYISSRSPT